MQNGNVKGGNKIFYRTSTIFPICLFILPFLNFIFEQELNILMSIYFLDAFFLDFDLNDS